ncbi:hypothetical protein AS850_02890 [Frondihabitans sp. 762G35]|uniref:hypothetical protein n=1 Tax=Frondihabitans sp. 762G35 TaxID=1446794 RepID=UPI000D2232ED|nr:hypothetical protein [Frondihabitans sp. 762G35]ARC56019.1 hypothetical protein AS850_02890 [Frondihabitans sp. 762G35]
MKRDTRSAYRARAKATDATVDAAAAEIREHTARAWAEARALVAERERTRHRFTREELIGVTHIRTNLGWHKVIRINARSVTVDSGYSWTDSYRFDRILDVKPAASPALPAERP